MRKVIFLLAASLLTLALAHDTQTVGEGEIRYEIVIGYVNEPPYTEQLNGLDLIIRTPDDEPVENLESSLTEPGAYTFYIGGFIGDLEVDLTVPYDHEVAPAVELRFP